MDSTDSRPRLPRDDIRPSSMRLLALDVDGTLLAANGGPRIGLVAVLARAQERGMRVVLCTGRRYRRAREIAQAIGLHAPLVCNSGALVKDPRTDETLWRADLSLSTLQRVLKVFADHGKLPMSFVDIQPGERDIVLPAWPTGQVYFEEYLERNAGHALVDARWPDDSPLAPRSRFHLCAVGSRAEMLAFESKLAPALNQEIQTFVQKSPLYSGWMCEVLRRDAGKWTAVRVLAALWFIPTEQVCAFGDDLNDAAMIEQAGWGVAMPHAPECVRAVADQVLPDDESALAQLIERLISEHHPDAQPPAGAKSTTH